MPTEADTCRTLITPKLQTAGWENDPHSIAEQRCFTDGRIIVHGNRATRRKGKRADYLLRYTRDFLIAVVEAKPENESAASGLQQAKDYAEILNLKFAYATNGNQIIQTLQGPQCVQARVRRRMFSGHPDQRWHRRRITARHEQHLGGVTPPAAGMGEVVASEQRRRLLNGPLGGFNLVGGLTRRTPQIKFVKITAIRFAAWLLLFNRS